MQTTSILQKFVVQIGFFWRTTFIANDVFCRCHWSQHPQYSNSHGFHPETKKHRKTLRWTDLRVWARGATESVAGGCMAPCGYDTLGRWVSWRLGICLVIVKFRMFQSVSSSERRIGRLRKIGGLKALFLGARCMPFQERPKTIYPVIPRAHHPDIRYPVC